MKKYKSLTLFILIICLLTTAGAAWAYFSSTAQSAANFMGTGSMKLVLSDDNESQAVTITNTWNINNIMPGMQLPEKKIEVLNSSLTNGHHLNVKFSFTGSDDLAKNIIFSNTNNGFRYGGSSDSTSVNLTTALRGFTDADYIVKQGLTGASFSSTTVDGNDGTTPDGKISLSELAKFGKIRIEKGEERGGIDAGIPADFWLNADVATTLAAQNQSLDMIITFTLDQDSSQM